MDSTQVSAGRPRRGIVWLVLVLLAIGAVARALPFLDQGGRLVRQYPSEDGYLMLTIARNLALGNGMSTADGTLPTNGTQPGMTFVFAAGSWLLGGEREATVAFALATQFLVAGLGAFALYRLGRGLLQGRGRALELAGLAAGVWYAGGISVVQTMNCLETGAYACGVAAFMGAFLGHGEDPTRSWSVRRCLWLGLLLGLVFWVRIDAVFLILAACLTRACLRAPGPGASAGRLAPNLDGFRQACILGATAVLVASPWLIHNYVRFGSIMPVSGTSQSHSWSAGSYFERLPPILAESILQVVPIPASLEGRMPVVLACTALALAALACVVLAWRAAHLRARVFLALAGLYAVAMIGYYGFLFGAPWFLGRYLFPLSPLFALLWALVALTAAERLGLSKRPLLGMAAAALLVALVFYPNYRKYRDGAHHMHFQVVEWVAANVPDETWVAAVQTGTLGYYHDRTVNLDGKVNPDALHALEHGVLVEYLVASPALYFVDWYDAAVDWYENHELMREHFDLIVRDQAHDLGAMRRKPGSVPGPAPHARAPGEDPR